MERRGRIPVAKFRTQEGKTRSRSRVREPDYNEQDPETDLFTLLEDNIALKEANKSLKSQMDESNSKQMILQENNEKLSKELEQIKKQQEKLKGELIDVTAQFEQVKSERDALDKMHKASIASNLSEKSSSVKYPKGIVANSKLRLKLLQVLCVPTDNIKHDDSALNGEEEVLSDAPLTADLIEKLIDEFLTLKSSINAVELQLYEANEKISDLLENQQHLEHDNENLRSENMNLTKVAKLLTDNMKESVETSKKMEAALIKLKQRNDELMAKNRDLLDGPSNNEATTSMTSSNIKNPNNTNSHNNDSEQSDTQFQNHEHGERVVEMQNIIEDKMRQRSDEELESLRLKLSVLEAELRVATARAQLAESELEKYKLREKENEMNAKVQKQLSTAPPPPPPPPLPIGLLYKQYPLRLAGKRDNKMNEEITAGSIEMLNEASGAMTASSAIADPSNCYLRKHCDNKIIAAIQQQMKPETATGVDALVRELKSGRVTLRRNRRKTRTNEALQEMFQVLEISQQQNRNSKICINLNS